MLRVAAHVENGALRIQIKDAAARGVRKVTFGGVRDRLLGCEVCRNVDLGVVVNSAEGEKNNLLER